jgi:hypothetical protein
MRNACLSATFIAAAAIAMATIAMPISVAWPANAESDCPPGYYQASSGDCVPDPEKIPPNGLPKPPTAICTDGTYSFSEHPYSGGTCHGHGGVAKHLV